LKQLNEFVVFVSKRLALYSAPIDIKSTRLPTYNFGARQTAQEGYQKAVQTTGQWQFGANQF
jgi:hypothetical protein